MNELDTNTRNWGMLCHISALAALAIWGVGQIIGPLVVWLWLKEKYPFVKEQGRESLNFQITMTIAGAAAMLMKTTGAPYGTELLTVVCLLDLGFVVHAALQTSKGVNYRYPFSLKFVN